MRCRGRERRFADNHSLFLYSRPRVARALAAYKGEGATGRWIPGSSWSPFPAAGSP